MRRAFILGVLAFGVGTLASARAAEMAHDADAHIAHIVQNVPVGEGDKTLGAETLAQRMQSYHATAVSIAVINDYKIDWARGFGVIGPGSEIAVTDKTLFQAGSISKVLAALGILGLVDKHELSLDDTANGRLRSWKLPENEFTRGAPVTIRLLLSHSADTTVHGFPGHARDEKRPTLLQILDGVPPANTPAVRVNAVPGSRWQYSGGGYLILQQIAIDTTHEAFPEFMRDNVLRPAGMDDSTFEQPLPTALWPRAACGIEPSGEAVRGCWHVYPEIAAGGLWTTPTDLARLAIVLMHARAGEPNPLLSAGLAKEMFTPHGFATETNMNQGLGIFVDGTRFMHEGDDRGFIAVLVGYSSGQGVVVMANNEGGGGLLDDIARAVALEYHWPESDPLASGYR